MNIVFVLVPLGLVLIGAAIWALFWAVNNGQFDEVDSGADAPFRDDGVSSDENKPPSDPAKPRPE
ncbi:MAG TPA: cbb3-type cytochrome oxidase assembly protein CcoS [Steroidobacteraceae bacterium]|mgnify:CR=1 FL=1|nr:cbb3-type cytochrome oxidase assembly protein CcoS [Steroidobacteraceae bacterium]